MRSSVKSNGTICCVPVRMMSPTGLLVFVSVVSSLITLIVASHRLGAWPKFNNAFCPQRGGGDGRASEDGERWITTEFDVDRPPRRKDDPLCANFPDTGGILLVMRTGATESYARLPTQFQTALRCVDDFLVFSDLDQHIAGHHVRDSLDTVLEEVKTDNPDFDLYRRQQACPVDQEKCNKLGDPAREGWNLDKYKFMHVAEKTYALRPRADWYIFVDADTYVLWPNMVTWLRTLRPSDRHYIGSVAVMGETPFAHGGSGFVVSQGAMWDLIGKQPGIANAWDNRTKHECCGDVVFALSMYETLQLKPEQVWPTINGERPFTFPYGPGHWCQPIVTMHHMNSEEISSFWDFERRWVNETRASKPLLIRDIYNEFMAPKLVNWRKDWDNACDDRYYLDRHDESKKWDKSWLDRMKPESDYSELEKVAHNSARDCERACENLGGNEFFQWRYRPGVCSMSRSFRVGKPVKPDEQTVSGWQINKINEWIKGQGECESSSWPSL